MSLSVFKKILREYNLQKKNLTPGTEALVHIVKNGIEGRGICYEQHMVSMYLGTS